MRLSVVIISLALLAGTASGCGSSKADNAKAADAPPSYDGTEVD